MGRVGAVTGNRVNWNRRAQDARDKSRLPYELRRPLSLGLPLYKMKWSPRPHTVRFRLRILAHSRSTVAWKLGLM
jgi:hypothetical protein